MKTGKNLILCGFMGCGKSTVGALLAEKLGRRFVDTDSYIEEKEGRFISDIFREDGESSFRAMEKEACRRLAMEKGLIISVGGGTLADEQNATLLSKTGIIVFLEAPLSLLAERLSSDKARPLLQREDRLEAMKALYLARLPLYRGAAAFCVDASPSPEEVCREIEEKLADFSF